MSELLYKLSKIYENITNIQIPAKLRMCQIRIGVIIEKCFSRDEFVVEGKGLLEMVDSCFSRAFLNYLFCLGQKETDFYSENFNSIFICFIS